VPEETVGKTAKCPVCGGLLKVPAPPVAPPSAPAVPNAPTRPWNEAQQNPYAFTGAGAQAMPSLTSEEGRNGPPWEQDGPSFGSYFATCKLVIFDPVLAFKTMRRIGGLSRPTYYSLIAGWIVNVVFMFENSALQSMLPRMLGIPNQGAWLTPSRIVITVFSPLILWLILHVRCAMSHGLLLMLNGARQPYETTFRAVAYASGSVIAVKLIPVVGDFLEFIAEMVYSTVAIRYSQETTLGKAAVAALLPLLLFFCLAFTCGFAVAMIPRLR
jgi:hypothetical protein